MEFDEFTELNELNPQTDFANVVARDDSRRPSQGAQAFAVEPFHMRCPHCRKLYSVEPKLLGASEGPLAKFECVSCQTAFYALKPELHGPNVLETQLLETQFASLSHQPSAPSSGRLREGADEPALERQVRSTVISVPVESRECPNCQTLNALSAKECVRCEIVFDRFQPGVEAAVAGDLEVSENTELVKEWHAIQADYQDLAKHEAFVRHCFEQGRLAYASHKYAQVLTVAPGEAIAQRMRDRSIGLASYGFDATSNGLSLATWSFPLPSFNSFILLLGTILVVVGFGFPNSRHTAGLGFAMIALAMGLRFYLRRPRT